MQPIQTTFLQRNTTQNTNLSKVDMWAHFTWFRRNFIHNWRSFSELGSCMRLELAWCVYNGLNVCTIGCLSVLNRLHVLVTGCKLVELAGFVFWVGYTCFQTWLHTWRSGGGASSLQPKLCMGIHIRFGCKLDAFGCGCKLDANVS